MHNLGIIKKLLAICIVANSDTVKPESLNALHVYA